MASSTIERGSTSGSVCVREDESNAESSHARRRSNFINLVCESSDDSISHLKGLARGQLRHAWSYKGYFINGFKFHTEKYGEGRVTHNSRVCVKGACYNKTECDFYGLLEEVIEVAYRGVGRCVVILFKCKWFDAARGVRIDNKHNIVDIKYKSRLINDEPFVLALQVEQVYYAPYPSMTKDLKDWWVVVKTKSRSMYELEECENEEDGDDNGDGEEFFQESETLIPTTSRSSSETEEPICLIIQGELEIVNNNGDETQTKICGDRGAAITPSTGLSSSLSDAIYFQEAVEQRFTDPKVSRKITSILKTMFNGSWTTWKEVDKSGRDELWAHFKELFKWEGFSDVLVHDAWENSKKKRYPDIMSKARSESANLAQAAGVKFDGADCTILKPYNPEWIKSSHWEDMIDRVWNTPKWINKAVSGIGTP
ncbi:Transposase, Ptta/En/Spm [Artemisia annua]|uniref:Transposase, Ptta/En/Spm n=1 Tax=Artemisia annua TaxID=35608 RepID=A0A2U1LE49_ARTAN|nr:Transposase, Ptta/En/Spm [Artemisia annua]